MRDTLLTIHILASGVWIGTNVMGFVVNPRINPRASAIASDHWHRTVVGFKYYLYVPAFLTILVTGVLLITAVDDSPYELSDTFVLVGFLAVIFGSVLGTIYFPRQGGKGGSGLRCRRHGGGEVDRAEDRVLVARRHGRYRGCRGGYGQHLGGLTGCIPVDVLVPLKYCLSSPSSD